MSSNDDSDSSPKLTLIKGTPPRPVITCPELLPDRWYNIHVSPEARRLWEDKGICPMCGKWHAKEGR